MNKEDIHIADRILDILQGESGCVTGIDLNALTTDRAQIFRITNSLSNYGVATKNKLGLSRTEKITEIVERGGAKFIYEQEQRDQQRILQKDEDLLLSIKERKRNKYLSYGAFIISVIAIVISIISLSHSLPHPLSCSPLG